MHPLDGAYERVGRARQSDEFISTVMLFTIIKCFNDHFLRDAGGKPPA